MSSSNYITPGQEAEFREFVDKLFVKRRDGIEGYVHACIGLAGESGEVLDHFKKSWVYGREVDHNKVVEEMGDTLHYLFMLMIKMNVNLTDLINNNMAKLRKRYPEGYTDEAAIRRADATPESGRPVRSHTQALLAARTT